MTYAGRCDLHGPFEEWPCPECPTPDELIDPGLVDKAEAWDAIAAKNARIAELEAGYRHLHQYAPGAAKPWIEDQAEKLGISLEQEKPE